jgi:hypothetical protein
MYHSGDTSPFKGRESGTFNFWSLFPAPGQGRNAVTGNERKSGGLGGALDSLRLLGDALDLVQAGDDAAAQDVRSLGGHLGQNVLQLASVGDVLLVGGLDQIGLLDQVVFDLGGRSGRAQQRLELLNLLAGNFALALGDGLETLGEGLACGGECLDVLVGLYLINAFRDGIGCTY